MRLTLLLTTFLMILLAGCGGPSATQSDGWIFEDDYGRSITVPDSPKRIVSTSPAVTEIIYELGGFPLLVGRTDFCTYPEEALQVESIGGITNLNIEKVISLEPDMIISGSMVSKQVTEHFEKMGIPIAFVIEKHEFDGLYENISKIGSLIGRAPQADSLISQLKTRMKNLAQPEKKNTAYYVVGFGKSGNFTAGGSSYIDDLLSLSGFFNIAHNLEGWEFGLEPLMAADPDYIIIRKEDSATFCRTSPYSMLSAVRDGRVIGIESGTIDIQTPRNIDAIEYLTLKNRKQ